MTTSIYNFDGVVLAGAAAVQGTTVPALTRRIIRSAVLTNTTGAPISATLYLVPSGGAANAATTVLSARPIAAGETYGCPQIVNAGLNEGGSVYALGVGLSFRFTATDITNGA